MVRPLTYEHRGMAGDAPSEVHVTVIPSAESLALRERLATLRSSLRRLVLPAVIAVVLVGSIGALILLGARGQAAEHQAGRAKQSGAVALAPVSGGYAGATPTRGDAARSRRAAGRVVPVPGTIGYICPRPPLPAVIQIEPGVCP